MATIYQDETLERLAELVAWGGISVPAFVAASNAIDRRVEREHPWPPVLPSANTTKNGSVRAGKGRPHGELHRAHIRLGIAKRKGNAAKVELEQAEIARLEGLVD